MDFNNYNNSLNLSQPHNNAGRQPLQQLPVRSAFLLGRGPLPRPTGPEVAAATAMMRLNQDHHSLPPSRDENLDPQLRGPAQKEVARVRVRIPVNDKVDRDIDFPVDIPRRDFLDRVFATMSLDPKTAKLGWKTNDEGKRAQFHELETDEQIDKAFSTVAELQSSRRRSKEAYMLVSHLNPPVQEAAKKKADGNRVTDFAYSTELQMVKEKLRCAQHAGPNRWCYVNPQDPGEHIPLGYEEIGLWARKIHDNAADPDCVTPPHCLRLDNLRQRASFVRKAHTKGQVELPPIHVHINNAPPLGGTSSQSKHPRGTKRSRSSSSDSSSASDSDDSDSAKESLLISTILRSMHRRVPKLNLPQYEDVLAGQGIIYAKSVLDFDKDFYVGLGMAEGAVGAFLDGVAKAVKQEKREKKRIRLAKQARAISQEL